MSQMWPFVRLGEVLRHRKEFLTIDDLRTYKRPRVKLHAQGIVVRDQVLGAQIKTKSQQVCRAEEFLVAEIDAKVGGFGIVPPELDGAIVSSHYFLFVVNEARMDRRFLGWFIRTPAFREQVEAQGSTNYAAIRPTHVLGYQVPLPPLAEQRRIVARIEELASRISEACALRTDTAAEAEALFKQGRAELFTEAEKRGHLALGRVAVLERGRFSHRPRNDPRFFGGPHPWIQIAEIERSKKFIRDHSVTLNNLGLGVSKKFPRGTVLVSIAATIGAVGILDFDCCVPDSVVGVTPRSGIDSEFLYHFMGNARARLEELAPKSAQKNINLKILAALPVPRLTVEEQRAMVRRVDALRSQVDSLLERQRETRGALHSLLPSILDKAFKGEL